MIDIFDQKLIKFLAKDSRQSSELLANQLGVDPSTVRRRIKKLKQAGVLYYSVILNPDLIGLPVRAVLAMTVAPDKVSKVVESLKDHEEIRWISPTSGRFDVIAQAWFSSNDKIYDFVTEVIGKLEGIFNVETFICLSRAEDRVRY